MSLQSSDICKSDYQKLLNKYGKLKIYIKGLESDIKELNKEIIRLKKEINELCLLLLVKVDKEVDKNNECDKGFS